MSDIFWDPEVAHPTSQVVQWVVGRCMGVAAWFGSTSSSASCKKGVQVERDIKGCIACLQESFILNKM